MDKMNQIYCLRKCFIKRWKLEFLQMMWHKEEGLHSKF